MSESATPPALAQPEHRGLQGSSFGLWVLGPIRLLARFVYRHPRRAMLYSGLLVSAAALLVVIGTWIWFHFHLRAARTSLELGHNSEALRHLESCQRLTPANREVLLLSSRASRRFGSLELADSFLTRYWQLYGDEEPLVFERLLLRASKGEIDVLGSALRTRIQQGGSEGRLAREALVTGLEHRFRLAEARAVLDEWLSETPDDTLALLLNGKYYEQQLGYDDAIRYFQRVVELDPEHLEARLRLATIFVQRRMGQEAAVELEVLRVRLPDHSEVQILWAETLSLLGRTDEARIAVDRCLEKFPNSSVALAERASFALHDDDVDLAEQCLSRAVKYDPGNITYRTKYALALARNDKKAQSDAEYEKVRQLEADSERISELIRGPLQSNPNDASIHYEIGMIALRSGKLKEAIQWFHAAIQLDPNHLQTHRRLATIYHELENPVLAAKHRAIAQQLAARK